LNPGLADAVFEHNPTAYFIVDPAGTVPAQAALTHIDLARIQDRRWARSEPPFVGRVGAQLRIRPPVDLVRDLV
jgi:hypothetical protein